MIRRIFLGTLAAAALFPYKLLKARGSPGTVFGIEHQLNRFLSLHFDYLGFLPEMLVFNDGDYRELTAPFHQYHPELWAIRAVAWNFNGSQIQLRFDEDLKPGVFHTTGCARMFYFLTPRTTGDKSC